MKRFTVTIKIANEIETYEVEVEHAGNRDVLRILKEKILKDRRKLHYKILDISRKKGAQ